MANQTVKSTNLGNAAGAKGGRNSQIGQGSPLSKGQGTLGGKKTVQR